MKDIDLNCDMGESFGIWRMGQDEAVMPWISSANVACGMHAGDPPTMRATVAMARDHGVAVGAHVALPDLQGFGRRSMDITPGDLHALVIYQLGALGAFTRSAGIRLHHVKAHGALYHQAGTDDALARAFADAVTSFDASLYILTQDGSALARAATRHGLRALREGFVDRGYDKDGHLLPRGLAGSILDPEQAAEQARLIATCGQVATPGGELLAVSVDTLCVHGDRADAAVIAQKVHASLAAAGVKVRAHP